MTLTKSASMFAAVLALASMMAFRPAASQDQYKPQIDALLKAMEKYKDYRVAEATSRMRTQGLCTDGAKVT